MDEKCGVEKSRVGKFMVEKSGLEISVVELSFNLLKRCVSPITCMAYYLTR